MAAKCRSKRSTASGFLVPRSRLLCGDDNQPSGPIIDTNGILTPPTDTPPPPRPPRGRRFARAQRAPSPAEREPDMRRLERLFERYRRRGDVAALAKVFDRTAPEVLRVANVLAAQPAEAEDLLQATFLTAIERADAYDATRPLVPWLVGILRNHA